MSDALTNREIEDVLTSVRRLVGQDVHRAEGAQAAPAKGDVKSDGGRLILTQAQRIDAAGDSSPADGARPDVSPQAVVRQEAEPQDTKDLNTKGAETRGVVTDGAGIVGNIPQAPVKPPAAALPPAPDFRRLEATIAELEAAVSASGSVFEPDGTEGAATSNVTALYVTPSFVRNPVPEAAGAKPAAQTLPDPTPAPAAMTEVDPDEDDIFETVIDEATLRILVAQIVREELQGQLGERITLQVRKLVRSEIAKALDSRDLI